MPGKKIEVIHWLIWQRKAKFLRKLKINNCKHSMVDQLTKHCVNCGISLVEIDKRR